MAGVVRASTHPTVGWAGPEAAAPPTGWLIGRHWRSAFSLTDLTRVKSVRACLPFGRRVAAPAQSGADGFTGVGLGGGPLACGLAPFGNRTRQRSTGPLLSGPLAGMSWWVQTNERVGGGGVPCPGPSLALRAFAAEIGPVDRFPSGYAGLAALSGPSLALRAFRPENAPPERFRPGCAGAGLHPFFKHLLPRTSAICTAFSAAPLRRLSETHHSEMPLSMVLSWRMRLT